MLDRFEVSLLMDYYGCLLTEKQINIMNMYFNEDLSLAEIAEINHTSRQAIHDLIKRCYKQLVVHEEKLGLLQKNKIRNDKGNQLIMLLEKKSDLDKNLIEKIRNNIDDIINA